MKITIVQGAFFPIPPLLGGAVEKCWQALGREFARRGHQVTHVSRLYGSLPARETDSAGVEHRRVKGFDTPRSLLRLKLCDLLYSWRVLGVLPAADILVTNTFWMPMICRDPTRGRIYVHIARYPRRQMRYYTRAARLQTLTDALARAVAEQAPGSESRISVIANPTLDDVGLTREEVLALSGRRERVLLFVGRVHPEKGIALLLEAFRRFHSGLEKEGKPGWRLCIVGPWEEHLGGGGDAYRKELDQIVGPAAANVEWAGFVSDAGALREHLKQASLFIYPSLADKGEARPLAPQEAMSCGCPVLVSDMDCFRGYVTDRATGFTFDHHAADAPGELAAVLARLSDEPEELARVGLAGWDKAQEFSLERVANAYLADFESVLAASHGTSSA